MSKHTAGPWSANNLIVSAEVYGHPDPIAMMAVNGGRGDEALGNAQFIVRACNAHEDLLTAVLLAADYFERLPQFPDRGVDIKAVTLALRAAIAKAEA